jgi:hypothetical protein
MKHVSAVVLLVIGLSIVLISDARSQTRSDGLVVGVFRPDGVIVPFTRYARGKWTNPWALSPYSQPHEPKTIADLTLPWYKSTVSASMKWFVAIASQPMMNVNTSKSVQVCSHCQKVWGLPTDYAKSTQAGPNECVVNIGVAISQHKQVLKREQLTNASPEYRQIAEFVTPRFNQAESKTLSGPSIQQYAAQLPRAEARTKVQLSVRRLYRFHDSGNGRTLFYFEVSKEYAKPPQAHDAGCNNISMFAGWVVRNPNGKLFLLNSQFLPTDCDMKDSGLIWPLAIIKVDDLVFAVCEEDGYEGESYLILEIRRRAVRQVLETYSGSC